MMGYWYGGFNCIGMVVNLIISVALIIGLVFLVIWIVKRLSTNNSRQTITNAAPSAVEIAKIRYAKGEINREEFQKVLTNLETK